jgi:UPF0755 protein
LTEIAHLKIAGRKYIVKKRFFVIIAAIVLLAVAVPLFFHYFYPSQGDQPIYVRIGEGESVSSIGAKLQDQGVITSSTLFRFLAWLGSEGEKIKAGEHILYTGMRYGAVFEELKKSPVVLAKVTIPEGFTLKQIAARIGATGVVSAGDFLAAAGQGGYEVPNLPPEQDLNLEGLLFPKTYDLLEGMEPSDVVSMLLTQFQVETGDLDWSKAEELGLTPYQVIIAASIIEREVVVDDERSLAAAVIRNRLKQGMRLQMCSTVQYVLPEQKEVLTYKDLETPSPYNTYLHGGLPPAPICNPGLKSIEAALHPAQVDYLYFVATGEGNRHFFTADYNEFLKAKERAGL